MGVEKNSSHFFLNFLGFPKRLFYPSNTQIRRMNLKAAIFLAVLGLTLAKPQLPKGSDETISDKVTPMPPGELGYEQGPIRKPGVLPEVEDYPELPPPEADALPDPTPAEADSDKDDSDGDSTSSDATKDITTITPKPEPVTTTTGASTTTAKTTTTAATSSTTPKPTTTTKAPMTSTAAPAPRGGGGFSGWSFFGGIIVTLIGLACGFLGMKYYKTRQAGGGNYSSFR